MNRNGPIQQPRLTAQESKTVLDMMDREARDRAPAQPKYKRRLRVNYNSQQVVLGLDDTGGTAVAFAVQARNISIYGISIIHSQFVHTGRKCRVSMPSLDGGAMLTVPGKISRCRFVKGRVHEVSVVFDQPLDVSMFVRLSSADEMRVRRELQSEIPESRSRAGASDAVDGESLAATVLVVDDFPANLKLFSFWLTKMGLHVMEATDAKQAELQLAGTRAQILVIDNELGVGESGIELVRRLRARRMTQPMILVSADASDEARTAAKAAGVSVVLQKPFQRSQLQETVQQLLSGANQGAPVEVLRSSMSGDKDMAPLIVEFVSQVRELTFLLRLACENSDRSTAGNICSQLAESGEQFGFGAIAERGRSAGKRLARPETTSQELSATVEELIQLLERVAV